MTPNRFRIRSRTTIRKFDDSLEDFAGGEPIPELVECYMAANTVEAKFIANELMEQGIPAIADKIDTNLILGGFQPQLWGYGPKVRVRPEDLARAQAWLTTYDLLRKRRKESDLD